MVPCDFPLPFGADLRDFDWWAVLNADDPLSGGTALHAEEAEALALEVVDRPRNRDNEENADGN